VVLKDGAEFSGIIVNDSPEAVSIRSQRSVWVFAREKVSSVVREEAGRQREQALARAIRNSQWESRTAFPAPAQGAPASGSDRTFPPAAPLPIDNHGRSLTATGSDVVVYGTSWCGYCARARAYLTSRGIPFVDKDVEHDREARDEIARKCAAAGMRFTGSVPVLDVYGRIIRGFDPGRIDRAVQEHEG
jgi:glutaredoxin